MSSFGHFSHHFCARTLFLSKPKHPGRVNAGQIFNLKHPEILNEAPFPTCFTGSDGFSSQIKNLDASHQIFTKKEDAAVRQRATKRPR